MNAEETDAPAANGAPMETIGLTEAAAYLRMAPSTLRKRAAAGLVPGAKFGRSWIFVRADLLELIREQAKARARRPITVATLRVDFSSTAENRGSQLARQIEKERKELERRQPTARQRRRP